MADLSALHEPIGEAIGLALDRVPIVLVGKYGAFRVQYEAGRRDLLADGRTGAWAWLRAVLQASICRQLDRATNE
jgi:hypothetical protein